MTLQAEGSYAKAKAILERLAVVRPETQRVLDRLKDVPVDVEPRFVTAEELVRPVSALFTPLRLRETTLRNRIAVSPMCQYSARDGLPTAWHLVHLGSRAVGGAGLVIAEATAVSPEGRISPDDTGIWSDAHAEAWAPVARFVAEQGAVAGLQLAHAGRKASTDAPWRGGRPVGEGARGWRPVAPSPLPFDDGHPVPRELSADDLPAIVGAFRDAARRADAGRLRGGRDPHGARLPPPPVPLPAHEPADGRVRRAAREPHAPAPRGGARRARGLPGGAAGLRADLGDGLGGGRLGPRAVGRLRARAARGGGRPRRLLERRDRARTRRSPSRPATRCRSRRRSASGRGS